MFPLFESICIKEGKILNANWHEKRFKKSYENFYSKKAKFKLVEKISIPYFYKKGLVKLKIFYNENGKEIQFKKYIKAEINSIKIINSDSLDYKLKYSNREDLNKLFKFRGPCDDILIVRNGKITDSLYANVVFYDGKSWITPEVPLLRGTCRDRLITEGKIEPRDLTLKELKNFKGVKLINAMRDLDQNLIPINKIIF